jgi:hypothetical protein
VDANIFWGKKMIKKIGLTALAAVFVLGMVSTAQACGMGKGKKQTTATNDAPLQTPIPTDKKKSS